MNDFKRWSQSALYTLELCGERFRRRYIEGEDAPPTAIMVRGTAVHYVAAEAHKQQMFARGEWDGDPPAMEAAPGTSEAREQARDLAAQAFNRQRNAGITFSREDERAGVARVEGEQKDAAVALAALYVDRAAPRVYPIAVERRIIVKPKDTDVSVSGILDLVERLPSGGECITDEKTTERTPPKDAADRSRQLTMYALIRKADVGKLPERTSLVHLVKKRGQVDMVRQDSRRTEGDVGALVNRLNRAIESVKRGVFMPNTNGWHCSPRWCPYFESCPFPEGKNRYKEGA